MFPDEETRVYLGLNRKIDFIGFLLFYVLYYQNIYIYIFIIKSYGNKVYKVVSRHYGLSTFCLFH